MSLADGGDPALDGCAFLPFSSVRAKIGSHRVRQCG
jgi:hypothetical protein